MPSEMSLASGDQSIADLRRELSEAREQQAATAEILRVISTSPMDLQRAFADIAASAARLCDAYHATIRQVDDGQLRLVAHYGPILTGPTVPLMHGAVAGRAVLDRQTIHLADEQFEMDEYPEGSKFARRLGYRTILCVPLLRAAEAIGVITIRRTEVRPFTDRQIDLLKTFADQAVIAIENTRLFEVVQARTRELTERTGELTETLEYQTATSDVLNVISRSPTSVQPVFETIARSAARLCSALNCFVYRFDGNLVHFAAGDGLAPEDKEGARSVYPLPPGRASAATRAILYGTVEEIPDVERDPDYQHLVGAQSAGYRSIVAVPMLKGGCPIGAIGVTRSQVGRFPRRQIELLQTFADQAVIAVENARLFEAEQSSKHELQESLEQQTAMSEILSVISSSPGELAPVFRTMLESAVRICGAKFANLFLYDGEVFQRAAMYGAPAAFAEVRADKPIVRPYPGSVIARVLEAKQVVHVADIRDEQEYIDRSSALADLADLAGARTLLIVPMLKEGEMVGTINIYRQEVRPFSDKQIKLVTSFASQAVIAIENTRLLNELRESLQQQTATADVLKVISRATFDLPRVLDTLVESAASLCDAYDASIVQKHGGVLHIVSHRGQIPSIGREGPLHLTRGSTVGRAVLDVRTIHVADLLAESDEYPEGSDRARRLGFRTILIVPLARAGMALGAIVLRRAEVRPFTDRQIELLQTFAHQAVIAIENARLFAEVQTRTKELQDSLDRQTATSEVLGVISRSPNEVQPVLDTIVATAHRLCEAERAVIWRLKGETFRPAAHCGQPEELVESLYSTRLPVSRGSMVGRATLARTAVQVEDVATDPELIAAHALHQASNVHTVLAVPLLLQGEPIGVITLTRTRVAPFDDKQVALIESFADQAVIAIENSRLFEAEQASKRELARSVEELESLGKVSQAVNSSLELDKVLPTILEHACAMSYAGGGTVYVFDETTGEFRLAAAYNMSDEHVAMVRAQPIRHNSAVVGECATRRAVVQVADLSSAAPSPLFDILLRTGVRAVLAVPLLHQAEVGGVLVVRRNQPGTFSPEVIRLVEAFAAQSAIAVENARLFGEIAQKSRELEIASQHKSQFVANMSHELRTPLAAILGYAELTQEGFYGPLPDKSMNALTRIRSNGKHLLGLINTVLDIAKIESGQFNLNLAEYALENVVETVRAATEALAETKKLGLKTEIAERLPIGIGDEQRLTQVLLNLVGNAIKFTDAGEVCITATASNGHFGLSVTDTGPGIPQEHQARIFEQFHQVDSSNTKAKGGTGLGLAIAKQIVEMHGGRIWVESTLGKGATFQMELPIHAENRKAMA